MVKNHCFRSFRPHFANTFAISICTFISWQYVNVVIIACCADSKWAKNNNLCRFKETVYCRCFNLESASVSKTEDGVTERSSEINSASEKHRFNFVSFQWDWNSDGIASFCLLFSTGIFLKSDLDLNGALKKKKTSNVALEAFRHIQWCWGTCTMMQCTFLLQFLGCIHVDECTYCKSLWMKVSELNKCHVM